MKCRRVGLMEKVFQYDTVLVVHRSHIPPVKGLKLAVEIALPSVRSASGRDLCYCHLAFLLRRAGSQTETCIV